MMLHFCREKVERKARIKAKEAHVPPTHTQVWYCAQGTFWVQGPAPKLTHGPYGSSTQVHAWTLWVQHPSSCMDLMGPAPKLMHGPYGSSTQVHAWTGIHAWTLWVQHPSSCMDRHGCKSKACAQARVQ